LLANLQESAWWQAALSERMGAYVGWALLTLGLVLLVTIIVAFTTVGDQTARQLFGTLVANVVLVLMATRTADLWWRFHTHAGKVRAVGAKADMVASGGRPLETTDVLHLVHDYDIALSGAPQVPDKVYWWHRDELNALWDRRL